MILYAVIMLLTALPIGWLSAAIYRGKTDLIHDYHQTKVTDQAAYGKAFGKALFVISAALLISGIAALFPGSGMIPVALLFIGLFIGIASIIAVQMKYNKGIF